MTVADRIKNRRIELGLSQEELAERAGYCGKPPISRFEHSGNEISMKQVKRLADALECTSAYLMGWETPAGETISATPSNSEVVNTADIPRAIELYKKYENASPEVRAAVELLLKGSRSDS